MPAHVRLTVYVTPELRREAKRLCAERDCTLGELFAAMFAAHVREERSSRRVAMGRVITTNRVGKHHGQAQDDDS